MTIIGGFAAAAGAAVAGGLVTAAAVNPAAAEVRPAAATHGHPGAGQPTGSGNDAPAGPSAAASGRPTPTPGGTSTSDITPVSALAASGIPSIALTAYQDAATRESLRNPACALSWPLLAAIGRVESNHGRFAGAVLHADGLSTPPVIGIPLNGHGTAYIGDTDHGRLDGDTVYDHAVGPMQFIPSTWAHWGADGNGDGAKDPFNIFDAAQAAADYLCAAGRHLSTASGQLHAILSYNYSYDYVSTVMGLEAVYARGVGITVPMQQVPASTQHGRPKSHPPLPPVDPGKPPGLTPSTPGEATRSTAHAHTGSTGSSAPSATTARGHTTDPTPGCVPSQPNGSDSPSDQPQPTPGTLDSSSAAACATSTVPDAPSDSEPSTVAPAGPSSSS